ncbi:MAG: hypothetical protein EOO38_12220 [Cytophagaceae bacterium]|nr:MAG: hypothetical protein EOO38_12220 [Cytophagaceae bacterium]
MRGGNTGGVGDGDGVPLNEAVGDGVVAEVFVSDGVAVDDGDRVKDGEGEEDVDGVTVIVRVGVEVAVPDTVEVALLVCEGVRLDVADDDDVPLHVGLLVGDIEGFTRV